MDKYVCTVCGYVYDPEEGDPENDIEPGTKFEDLPDDWQCPVCGASKDEFEPEEQYFLDSSKEEWPKGPGFSGQNKSYA